MKKLNKFFAVLVALAMMATLAVSMAFAAPAYNGVDKAITGGTVADPATGVITKILKAGKGTVLPDAGVTFYFDYTQDKTTAGLQTADATISQRSVTFAKNATVANSTDDTDIYVAMVSLYDKDTGKQTVNDTFPKVGRYVFDVKERQSTPADATTYDYTLSLAEYKLTIDVAQDTNGDRYVANIAVQQTKEDTTNTEDATLETQPKVDPTPDTDNSNEDDNLPGDETIDPYDGSEFKFTNYVIEKTDVDPDGKDEANTGDNAGLYVQKTVVDKNGNALEANSNAKTQDFNFDVTVKIPEAAKKAGRTSYTAVVIDTAEEVAENASYTVKATYTFTDNVQQTVKLKDGWRLVFKDIDIGAIYSVSEQADTGYNTTYASKANNEDYQTAASNKNVTVNKDYVGVKNQMILDETPTGILISNLPYIALALVAIGGLVAYVVVRRKDEDNA